MKVIYVQGCGDMENKVAVLMKLWEEMGRQTIKKNKSVNPKGTQPWILIGRTDAEAEASVLWPPDANSQLIGKDLDAGKDWKQKEKKAAEDEMVR